MKTPRYAIPAGFTWNHVNDCYTHPDGRTWDAHTNVMCDDTGTPIVSMDETLEQELQRKGKTAPRVTLADVDAAVVGEEFHVFAGSTLTVCVLTLRNGFTVTGESACASPENFDLGVGQRLSRDDAKRKIWPLLGYVLREKLYQLSMHGEQS